MFHNEIQLGTKLVNGDIIQFICVKDAFEADRFVVTFKDPMYQYDTYHFEEFNDLYKAQQLFNSIRYPLYRR